MIVNVLVMIGGNMFYKPRYIDEGAVGALLMTLAFIIEVHDPKENKTVKLLDWKTSISKFEWYVLYLCVSSSRLGVSYCC